MVGLGGATTITLYLRPGPGRVRHGEDEVVVSRVAVLCGGPNAFLPLALGLSRCGARSGAPGVKYWNFLQHVTVAGCRESRGGTFVVTVKYYEDLTGGCIENGIKMNPKINLLLFEAL